MQVVRHILNELPPPVNWSAPPEKIYRRSDGDVFIRNAEGLYQAAGSRMAEPYTYTLERLLSDNGFTLTKP